jgi:[acyl-carrier-protein] S-malonyltransferase
VSYALLFPGQGSQAVGMGADLFASGSEFLGGRADSVLGWPLRELCLEGPEEALTRTDRAQPALFAVSYALWAVLRERVPPPAAAAGHSLGEYIALAAAGSLSFEEGLRLVAARGAAMARAADLEPSGMAALLGAGAVEAEALCAARRAAGGRLWVANLNAPGQVVVAGGADDVQWAAAAAREHGIRRAVPLKVAGAFHSPFMAPAAEELAAALEHVRPGLPSFPVWANATAAPHRGDVAGALVAQLTAPVRFAETLAGLAEAGIRRFVHVGPGDVTAGLARRSVEGAEVLVVSSPADVDDAAAAIGHGERGATG